MRVLFISEYYDEPGQGAYQSAQAHYHSLSEIFGKENVDIVSLKSNSAIKTNSNGVFLSGFENKLDKLRNLMSGYAVFFSSSEERYILEALSRKKYDLVWFDNSYFGSTIKRIKLKWPAIQVWVFYHGVKANSSRQIIKNNILKPHIILSCINNVVQEKYTVKYADAQILLNKRDETELLKYYGKKADLFLPVYYLDTASFLNPKLDTTEFRILFVGGYFWPNINGIKWFVKKVLPFLKGNFKLYIVGRGMELLRKQKVFENDRVEIVGGTDNLAYWYNMADLVVGPIFQGDGMKTKTAEALMYGKRYLGTKEALCGYEGLESYHCETPDDYIESIGYYMKNSVEKYDPQMRTLYEKYYSTGAAKQSILSLVRAKGLKDE